ncbi:transglycosylase SLT domain-containing protein [candidate division WOR-3 bacterium]|nr:transglycosylase SLT domain-containing protein [candidate division WOR-3 bacterium]
MEKICSVLLLSSALSSGVLFGSDIREIEIALQKGDVLLARDLLSYVNEFDRASPEYCISATRIYFSMNAIDSSLFWARKIADKNSIPVEIAGPLYRYDNNFMFSYDDFARAVQAFEKNDFKVALDMFRKSMSSGKTPRVLEDYSDYFVFLSLLQTGDTVSAIELGEDFCDKYKSILNSDVSKNLSRVYLSRGERGLAVEHLRAADFDQSEKLLAARIFLSVGDTDEAITNLNELLSSSGEVIDTAWSMLIELGKADTVALARAFEKSRKYEKIVDLLETFLESHPGNLEASLLMGRALRKLSKYSTAVVYLERASSGNNRRNALYNLGLCYRSTGNETEEERVWSDFIREFNSGNLYDDALFFLAELKIKNGRRTEAIGLLRSVLESPHSNDMIPKAAEMLLEILDDEEKAEFEKYVLELPVGERNVSLVYSTALSMESDQANNVFIKICSFLPMDDYARRSEIKLSESRSFSASLHLDFLNGTDDVFSDFSLSAEAIESCERARHLYAFGLRDWARKELDAIENPNPREKFLMSKTADQGLDRFKAIVLASSVKSHFRESCPSDLFFLLYPQAFRLSIENAAKVFSLKTTVLQGLVRTESLFDNEIRSWAGAVGLAQLMPATANYVASSIGMNSFDLTHPDHNLRLGSKYLSDQLHYFGKIYIALAAYNAGPGNAKKWICEGGEDEYISNIGFSETRAYVPKVLTAAWIYDKIDRRTF